jgi:hypothetical protein
MSEAPITTLTLKGKLKDPISIKLFPFNEFQQGRWNICVSQLIFHVTNDVRQMKEICGLSCNFVKTKQYSTNNELETIFQNLHLFILQGTKNEKKIVNFEKKWSLINNISEELKIHISNLANSETFDSVEADFYIVILLKRIK